MGLVTLHCHTSASIRLGAARQFLECLGASAEALLIGVTRDAVDDFVRELAMHRGAVFGLHRFSLRQLAGRVAAARLAQRGMAPSTLLGVEAVAVRATFEALDQNALGYLKPIAQLRSFGRTLASTIEDLRLGNVEVERLAACGPAGADLETLARRYAQRAQAFLGAGHGVRILVYFGCVLRKARDLRIRELVRIFRTFRIFSVFCTGAGGARVA